MKYNEFINRLKAEIATVENGLILSQCVDYRRDHVEDEDTCYAGIIAIIDQAECEAASKRESVEKDVVCARDEYESPAARALMLSRG